MIASTDALSPVEFAKLENLEETINTGLKSFLDVGRALMQIRDEKLYRKSHDTFEVYCQQRWDMSIRFAQMQISAAKTADRISDANHGSPLPKTERVARPLTKLPEEDQADAWEEAVESAPNGKVTAEHVESVVKQRLSDAKEPEAEPEPPEPTKSEQEAAEIREAFFAQVKLVADGGRYTRDDLQKVFGCNREAVAWFLRMCEIAPQVTVHRNYGRKAKGNYSFEYTPEISDAWGKVRKLVERIGTRPDSSGQDRLDAEEIKRILSL